MGIEVNNLIFNAAFGQEAEKGLCLKSLMKVDNRFYLRIDVQELSNIPITCSTASKISLIVCGGALKLRISDKDFASIDPTAFFASSIIGFTCAKKLFRVEVKFIGVY